MIEASETDRRDPAVLIDLGRSTCRAIALPTFGTKGLFSGGRTS